MKSRIRRKSKGNKTNKYRMRYRGGMLVRMKMKMKMN